ncbi:hypothetical protein EBX93_17350, partial [bacterium]|nr:hypothetical protein [bacterium]
MFRFLKICCLLAGFNLFFTSQAYSNQPAIVKVQFGFPSANGPLIRNGNWVPVQIELDAAVPEIESDKFLIELESTDG